DAQFANVRVWRDLNQDGLSQANELFTLNSLHIASINLTPTDTTLANLGDGNFVGATSSFTRIDGSTGGAYDLQLGNNPINSVFPSAQLTDHIATSEDVHDFANVRGSGMVRDLREAAMLSQSLFNQLSGISSAMSRDQVLGQMDQLLAAWSATSPMATGSQQATSIAHVTGIEYRFAVSIPSSVQAQGAVAVAAYQAAEYARIGQ